MQVEKLSKEKDQISSQYKTEMNSAQKTLSEIQSKAVSLETKTKEYQDKFTQMQEQNKLFAIQLQSANDKLILTSKQLSEKQQQLGNLEHTEHDEESRLKDYRHNSTERFNKMKHKQQNLTLEVEHQKQELVKLQAEIASERNLRKVLEQDKQKSESLNQDERKQIEEQDKHIRELSGMLTAETKNAQQMTQQLADGISILKGTKVKLGEVKQNDIKQRAAISQLENKLKDMQAEEVKQHQTDVRN